MTTFSISAIDMQEFERNGQKWGKFHVPNEEAAPENKNRLKHLCICYLK
jgi:hypothetical protein